MARAVVIAVVVLPVVIAFGVAFLLELIVSEPAGAFALACWWIGVLGLSIVALLVSERAARRALPLSVLLDMELTFPGAAPSRFGVAKLAASTKDQKPLIEKVLAEKTEPAGAATAIVALAARARAPESRIRDNARRVQELSGKVGMELGLEQTDLDQLRWAAIRQDIAKLGVQADIRRRQGPFALMEIDLIKQNPVLGRILAVVGAYVAMTSVQAHMMPKSADAARAELARLSGSKFDPEVVRAFLAIPAGSADAHVAPLTDLRPSFAVLGRVAAVVLVVGAIAGLTGLRQSPGQNGVTADAGPLPATAPASSAGTPGTTTPTTGGLPAEVEKIAHGDKSHAIQVSDPTKGASRASTKGRSGSRSTVGSSSPGPRNHVAPSPPGTSGGSPPTTSGPPPPSTTTPPTTPPTTSGGSPPPTTIPSPPTTHPSPPTTDPPPPPSPAPATGLTAHGACEHVITGPEIDLSWRDSTSWWVTGYEILRSSNGSDYSAIASVSPHNDSYTDTAVEGLGTTYWYKVVALSHHGSSTSDATSATTPIYCVG